MKSVFPAHLAVMINKLRVSKIKAHLQNPPSATGNALNHPSTHYRSAHKHRHSVNMLQLNCLIKTLTKLSINTVRSL
jgi:hypothetical protein